MLPIVVWSGIAEHEQADARFLA